MSQELVQMLVDSEDYVLLTLDLYDGRLVKHEGTVYFIAERFGGWEIIEQTQQSNIDRVNSVENFMGIVTEIHGQGIRWNCKNVPESVDLRTWLLDESTEGAATASEPIEENLQEEHESEPPESVTSVQSSTPPPVSQTQPVSSPEPKPSPELVDPYAEDRQNIERLRTLLNRSPQIVKHLRRFSDSTFDPNDDATLANIVRSQPQLVAQLEKMSGVLNFMGMGDSGEDDSSTIPTTPMGKIKKFMKMEGNPLPIKIVKVFVLIWVGGFVLQAALVVIFLIVTLFNGA